MTWFSASIFKPGWATRARCGCCGAASRHWGQITAESPIAGGFIWVWVNTYRYILVGWTSIYQLFWVSLGTRVLTHPHFMENPRKYHGWFGRYRHDETETLAALGPWGQMFIRTCGGEPCLTNGYSIMEWRWLSMIWLGCTRKYWLLHDLLIST